MSTTRATVLSLPNRVDLTSQGADAPVREASARATLGPIDDMIIMIGDRELETYARLFAMSPLRRGMTFEAYLATKGFARTVTRCDR